MHLNKVLQGPYCHLHAFLISDHHFIRFLLHLLLSCILVLPLDYLYTIADVRQFIGKNHPFLLVIVFLVDKLHHFIEVCILVDLSQVFSCLLCEHIHVLHYLKGILYAFIIKLCAFLP